MIACSGSGHARAAVSDAFWFLLSWKGLQLRGFGGLGSLGLRVAWQQTDFSEARKESPS